MHTGVHLFAQNLLSTFNSQNRDLIAQLITPAQDSLFGFCSGCSDDFVGFFGGAQLGFVNDSSTSTCLCALASSSWACSAAFRPLAIFSARSSKALAMGGHTNFIVNHTRIANTIAWTNRVALILTTTPFYG